MRVTPGQWLVGGHRHDRQRQAVLQGGIDGDEPLDGAIHQEPGVLLDQVGFTSVAGREVEIALLDEDFLNAVHHQNGIAVAEFRDQHAH